MILDVKFECKRIEIQRICMFIITELIMYDNVNDDDE